MIDNNQRNKLKTHNIKVLLIFQTDKKNSSKLQENSCKHNTISLRKHNASHFQISSNIMLVIFKLV